MEQQTLPELKIELAEIDSRLAGYKQEKEIARMLERKRQPRSPRPERAIPKCYFTVVTGGGYSIPLSAYPRNAKTYATDLHKETLCVVRPINQIGGAR